MPVIDHTFMSLPFIPGDPGDLVTSGQYSDVDVMIGGTKDEGIINLLGAVQAPQLFEVVILLFRCFGWR